MEIHLGYAKYIKGIKLRHFKDFICIHEWITWIITNLKDQMRLHQFFFMKIKTEPLLPWISFSVRPHTVRVQCYRRGTQLSLRYRVSSIVSYHQKSINNSTKIHRD